MAIETTAFWTDVPELNDQWMHLVLNYIGPNSGEGIEAFKDGTFISSDQSAAPTTRAVGDGRVVVGRKYVYTNNYYSHVEMDELIFFNQALLEEEVRELYNMYQ